MQDFARLTAYFADFFRSLTNPKQKKVPKKAAEVQSYPILVTKNNVPILDLSLMRRNSGKQMKFEFKRNNTKKINTEKTNLAQETNRQTTDSLR